jgi:hypothetical protein
LRQHCSGRGVDSTQQVRHLAKVWFSSANDGGSTTVRLILWPAWQMRQQTIHVEHQSGPYDCYGALAEVRQQIWNPASRVGKNGSNRSWEGMKTETPSRCENYTNKGFMQIAHQGNQRDPCEADDGCLAYPMFSRSIMSIDLNTPPDAQTITLGE